LSDVGYGATSINTVIGPYGAAASALRIYGAGATYQYGAWRFGGNYTNTTYIAGDEGGNVRYDNFEANASVTASPTLQLTGQLTYTGGRRSALADSPCYWQAGVMADEFLSKRTDIYVNAAYQHANQTALFAQIAPQDPASTSQTQVLVRFGLRHKF
jgi:predicted porin